MEDLITYGLGVRELVVGDIVDAGITARDVLDGLEGAVNRLLTELKELGKEIRLQINISTLEDANKEVDRLKNKPDDLGDHKKPTHKNEGSSKLEIPLGGFGGELVKKGIEAIVEMGKDALKNAIKTHDMETSLSAITHSLPEAKRQIEDLEMSAAKIPYSAATLLPGIRNIESAGYAYERAKRDVWSAANTVYASGGNESVFENVIEEMQRAAQTNKFDNSFQGELTKSGIPITTLLQQTLPGLQGLSQQEAQDKLSKMTLSYDMVTNALYKASQTGGMFDHAMEKASDSIGGKWKTIMGYWEEGMSKLVDGQDKVIKQIEDKILESFKSLPEYVKGKQPVIDEFVSRWKELYQPLHKIGLELYNWAKPIMNFATSERSKDLIKSELNELLEAIKLLKHPLELILDIASALQPILQLATFLPTKLIEGLNWLIDKIKPKEPPKPTNILGIASAGRKNNSPGIAIAPAINTSIGVYTSKDWWLDPNAKGPKKENNASKPNPIKVGTNAITGGGRKQIIINVNAPMYKVDKQVFETVQDAVIDFEPKMKEAMLRILRSADAAM